MRAIALAGCLSLSLFLPASTIALLHSFSDNDFLVFFLLLMSQTDRVVTLCALLSGLAPAKRKKGSRWTFLLLFHWSGPLEAR
jgi:hypothetical protein